MTEPEQVPTDFVPLRERHGIHHQTCPESCWCAQPAPAVPVERLRALVRLLYPEEMTPTAKRMIDSVCDLYDHPETP